MTAVDDVIPAGEPIPDDVTAVDDRMGDDWYLTDASHWHCGELGVRRCAEIKDCDLGVGSPLSFAPLTVTAVREQPAEPERHRYQLGPNMRCGTCGRTVQDDIHLSIHEDPPGARDADGFLRLKGTATGDNQLDPEPVGRTDPDAPVLVFRSTSGRTEVARRAEGFSVHVLHGSDRLTSDEALRLGAKLAPARPEPQQADAPLLGLVQQLSIERYSMGYNVGQGDMAAATRDEAKAAGLFARVSALAPRLPVQAVNEVGDPLWIFGCGYVEASIGEPTFDHCARDNAGPWRPLLVGGNPAPDGDRAPEGWVTRDNIQYPVAEILLDMQQREAQVMKALGVARPEDVLNSLETLKRAASGSIKSLNTERDEARAEVERLKDERDKALGWRDQMQENSEAWRREAERLRADVKVFTDVFGAKPDPLVLRLPEVPEGTVALVTEDGDRFAAHGHQGGHSWWHSSRSGTMSLARLLSEVGPMRVELAPPREPRTAAEVWAAMSADTRMDLPIPYDLAKALDREAGL